MYRVYVKNECELKLKAKMNVNWNLMQNECELKLKTAVKTEFHRRFYYPSGFFEWRFETFCSFIRFLLYSLLDARDCIVGICWLAGSKQKHNLQTWRLRCCQNPNLQRMIAAVLCCVNNDELANAYCEYNTLCIHNLTETYRSIQLTITWA